MGVPLRATNKTRQAPPQGMTAWWCQRHLQAFGASPSRPREHMRDWLNRVLDFGREFGRVALDSPVRKRRTLHRSSTLAKARR